MSNLNVLITGSGSIYGVALIKSLLKSDLSLKIVACDLESRTLGLYLAHRGYIVPPVDQEERYLGSVLNIINKEKIDAVFVASSHEIEFYSHNRLEIEWATGARVFVNPPAVLAICNDKWRTVNFLKKHHFRYPLTIRYPEDWSRIDGFIRKVGFPLVVKPRRGAGSVNLYRADDRAGLEACVRGRQGFILQQYLPEAPGEYTTGICAGYDGRILSGITLKRFLQEGMTMAAVADDFNQITDYCKQVASTLKPYGPCNFQLRLLDGKPCIFEINPRFSSSTGMRCLLGVNEADILLRAEILGETITLPEIKKAGLIRQYKDYLVPLEQMEQLEREKFCSNRQIDSGKF
jgi:carbamoyl-phosphate synthase large subunit